jgi:hypothetical protein
MFRKSLNFKFIFIIIQMNILNILFIITIIICIVSVFLSIKAKSSEEYFLQSAFNPDDINPFTTNKFLYSAGYISKKDCSKRCLNRFKSCKTNFPIGNSDWCNNLYDECTAECKWNNVFN